MITKKSPWRRIAITLSAMLLVLLLAASYRFVQSRGVFTAVEDKSPAACRVVENVGAVAAIGVDAKTAIAYVASRAGAVYALQGGAAIRLAGTPKDFRPVALSIAETQTGAMMQAVFARADGSYAIAVFRVMPGKLAEIGRLTTDLVTDPAAIASVDGERFYLVNRHATHTALGRWLDDAFLLPRAEVLFFDGMKFVKVAERLVTPTGLALSPDASRLYVAEELPRNLVALTRSEFSGAIANPMLLDIGAAPIALVTAPDASLIVTAWPRHGAGAVYRVHTANGAPQSAELLYSSKTEPVTAAAQSGNHLLIGSGKKLLDCTL